MLRSHPTSVGTSLIASFFLVFEWFFAAFGRHHQDFTPKSKWLGGYVDQGQVMDSKVQMGSVGNYPKEIGSDGC